MSTAMMRRIHRNPPTIIAIAIARMMRPAWGEVLVLAKDRDRAKGLVDGFLAREGVKEEPSAEG